MSDEGRPHTNQGRAPDDGLPAESSTARRKRRPDAIGRALRSVYDDTLREHVPDDFLNLLGKLD